MLNSGVTALEMAELEAFMALEPFGFDWENHRFGNVCAIVGNANRDPKSKPFVPRDFFPIDYGPEEPKPERPQQQQWEKDGMAMEVLAGLTNGVTGITNSGGS